MKSITKLKDDARKHELREEWEKAVQVYLQVLKIGEQGEGEVELPLYNRVGDLYVRLGRAPDAVRYYEQAADRYADAGLYNNAIALCNKAMRYQPHHLGLLRKLGMFSALQGFYADARRYYVEYADKQIAQGKVDDALSALMDFARVADDADSRELLGRRLHERGRTAEALAELRTAHGLRVRSGQTDQADALRREIRTIDPSARFEQDELQPRPPSSSLGADLPGLSHFEADPFGETDVDRSASGNVQVEESGGTGYGLVDITGFDDIEDATRRTDLETFESEPVDFETSAPGEAIEGFFGSADEAADEGFDLPLLSDVDGLTGAEGFGLTGPGAADRGGFGSAGSGLEGLSVRQPGADEFDDFDSAAGELPLLEESEHPPLDLPENRANLLTDVELEDLSPADEQASGWPAASEGETAVEENAGFDEFFDIGVTPTSEDALGGFAGWPEDPDADPRPRRDERPSSFGNPRAGASADEDQLDGELDDFGAWDLDGPTTVEEMALEASAVAEQAIREAEEAERREAEEAEQREAEEAERLEAEAREFERLEAEAREAERLEAEAREFERLEAEAREFDRLEAEARAAAAREAEAREAAAREAAARDQEARAAPARAAEARAAAAREAEARAAAAREAEARAAEEREAQARAAAAREAAARDPWASEPRTATRPAAEPPRTAAAPPSRPAGPARRDESYVDLGSLFADDEVETTRFRIQESLPTGDEDQDFAELLGRFKEKVAEHLPPEDAAAHYDLGLAFKEMGLIDEAIAEFQVALRTGHMRLKVYEELGYCFLHKQQYNIAEKVLRQALQIEHRHELELLGIYYQLGRAYEAMGRLEQARDAYERVLGMDVHFQDTSERLARL